MPEHHVQSIEDLKKALKEQFNLTGAQSEMSEDFLKKMCEDLQAKAMDNVALFSSELPRPVLMVLTRVAAMTVTMTMDKLLLELDDVVIQEGEG